MKVKSLSRVRLLVTPWTAAYQAPPSMGFSRQEYWSGSPLPSPSALAGGFFSTSVSWKARQTLPQAENEGASQVVKEPTCQMQETQEMRVRFPGLIDPLEEGTATHSSILACGPTGCQQSRCKRRTGAHLCLLSRNTAF